MENGFFCVFSSRHDCFCRWPLHNVFRFFCAVTCRHACVYCYCYYCLIRRVSLHRIGTRYFTWDKKLFPTPIDMQKKIAAHGRKMVTIVDPHLKRDNSYHIHKEATSNGLYIQDHTGKDFDGWCWPGSSSYLDFTAEHVRSWWADQFAYDKYVALRYICEGVGLVGSHSIFFGPIGMWVPRKSCTHGTT
jgi:alpha 1,3-glucosidase